MSSRSVPPFNSKHTRLKPHPSWWWYWSFIKMSCFVLSSNLNICMLIRNPYMRFRHATKNIVYLWHNDNQVTHDQHINANIRNMQRGTKPPNEKRWRHSIRCLKVVYLNWHLLAANTKKKRRQMNLECHLKLDKQIDCSALCGIYMGWAIHTTKRVALTILYKCI